MWASRKATKPSDRCPQHQQQSSLLSYYGKDRDEATALQKAHQQWRNNIFKNIVMTQLLTPEQFDAAGEFVIEIIATFAE